jgi:pimeloyl-ACP methyl ester carboxylesterase
VTNPAAAGGPRPTLGTWEVQTGPHGLLLRRWHPSGAPEVEIGVVAVHGTMDRSASFTRTAEALAEELTVPFFDAYDRAGYARSAAVPPRARIEESVSDLMAIIAGRRVVVVGHSLGAVIALAAAERHPDAIASVVAFEPPMPWVEPAEDDAKEAAWATERPREAAEIFLRRVAGDRAWQLLPQATKEERRREGVALAADLASLRTGESVFDPSAVRPPVLVGSGSLSSERHRRIARLLAGQLPDAELVELEGAPHGAHRSSARAFARLVLTQILVASRHAGPARDQRPLPCPRPGS